MPGAKVTELIDKHGFKGLVSLRAGPVQLQFKGEGQLSDLDEAVKAGSLTARGSDGKGRGNFSAQMRFRMAAIPEGTLVSVDTDLALSGMVAQYGRGAGVVREIASQLTSQFSKTLAEQVLLKSGVAAVAEEFPATGTSVSGASDIPSQNNAVTTVDQPNSINVIGLLWASGWSALKRSLSRLFGNSKNS